MSATAIVIIADLATLVLAIIINAVMIGVRWGEMRRDVVSLKESVSEIKGMFVMKLKE